MKKIIYYRVLFCALISSLVLTNCKTVEVPEGVNVVNNFDATQYMGTWYEIARCDFKHVKVLSYVTATCSLHKDGSGKVVNKGYNMVKNKWEESNGKARFLDDNTKGALKVSFFGPFYS